MEDLPAAVVPQDGVSRDPQKDEAQAVTAQVESESKIEAKLKALHHIIVSSVWFQALKVGLIGSTCTALPGWE
jgi:hypothetical protein